jgi:PAS domain S-box-containing protein
MLAARAARPEGERLRMRDAEQERRWFWATLMLSSISIVAVVFAFWELVENHFFRDLNYVSLHYLYISRGIASSLLLALWAAWFVLRQRRAAEAELRRSRERYRGLLEASPGAVALYDRDLQVAEWNAAAERLYGFAKTEVIGHPLPTVPPEKEVELEGFLRQVEGGDTVLDWETMRMTRQAHPVEVQLSLLPFREGGRDYFLEVTADIRERVRLRQTLLEVEKLTSMGKMAAGTAHHLNTPMASMLLRVQMMRQRAGDNGLSRDLEQLENTLGFCQQFVRRLLEFSRRPAPQKRPEEIGGIVEAVVGFLAPSIHAKQAQVTLQLQAAAGHKVLADANQLETLLLILVSNALDAIAPGGAIAVRCRRTQPDFLDVEIEDNGCGISTQDLPRIFEPFFTTKPPGKGTGLGLAIARNIVAEHGGAIRLEPGASGGAVACVQLPLYREVRVRQEAAP